MMENKKIRIQLTDDSLEKVNGGFSPYGGTVCDRCGGIKDNPSVPDEQRCHCAKGIYYNPYMTPV